MSTSTIGLTLDGRTPMEPIEENPPMLYDNVLEFIVATAGRTPAADGTELLLQLALDVERSFPLRMGRARPWTRIELQLNN